MGRARSWEELDGEVAGGGSRSKGRMTVHGTSWLHGTEFQVDNFLSFPCWPDTKRGVLVSCTAWGCTRDKYMRIEKGKEERGRQGGGEGGERENSTWLGMRR